MIKKIIGILALLAIIALIVYTAIGAGTYKSMLPEDLFTKTEVTASEVLDVMETTAADVGADEPTEQITE